MTVPRSPFYRPKGRLPRPLGQDLRQAQVHHLDLAERANMIFDGFKSRWITPRA